jgi:esterase/lipase superfamily enzyme
MRFYAILLALICLTLPNSASAQVVRRARAQVAATDVAGKVVDEAGAAVAEATVTLVNRTTHEEWTTKTNASGEFIFHGVSFGSYALRAAADKLASLQTEVAFSAEPRNPITLRLLPVRTAARATRPPEPKLTLPAPPPPATAAMAEEPNYYTVKIYYATDRKATGQTAPADFYGSDRDPNADENLSLGTCEVSIPRDHQLGELEAPSIWKLEFREDPEKHVVLLSVHPEAQNQFFGELANTVAASENKEAFVFIHGYKTTFKDAARRTAQLAYDLNFHGAPILYSWPSKGDLDGYAADEGTVIWTTPHLKAFLRQVALESHAKTVHLIAHSMGNRALTQALYDLGASPGGTAQPHFREVILAAPDVDRDVFKQLASAIEKTADRVTLYASSHDEALAASKKLHDFPRAGEAGKRLLVMKGIDAIDVSEVDTSFLGHSYFGDNSSVISDIERLLKRGFPPSQRACLSEAFSFGLAYWIFLGTSCPAN